MLKGDVHRFYRNLQQRLPRPVAGKIPDLDHVRAIAEYYRSLDQAERQLLLAWARKEESGIGVIPLAVSGVPLISLIFAPLLQDTFKGMPAWLWMALYLLASIGVVAGFYVHQRQRAFTTLHIALLEQAGQTAPAAHAAEEPDRQFPPPPYQAVAEGAEARPPVQPPS